MAFRLTESNDGLAVGGTPSTAATDTDLSAQRSENSDRAEKVEEEPAAAYQPVNDDDDVRQNTELVKIFKTSLLSSR